MYQVTAQQKAHITSMVRKAIADASAYYDCEFDMPTVTFDSRGTNRAGYASHHKWLVNFHAGYVQHFYDDYIKETIVHEVAHLITGKMYPDTLGRRAHNGRRWVTVKKASHHGSEWKNVMVNVFHTEPSRCHNWQLPGVTRRSSTRVEYKCKGCGATVGLGPKQHQKQQAGANYSHKGCRGAGLVLNTVFFETPAIAAQSPAPTPKPKSTGNGTKAARAQVLIKGMQGQGYPRKDIIEHMMVELEMGKPGASTYYQKYK